MNKVWGMISRVHYTFGEIYLVALYWARIPIPGLVIDYSTSNNGFKYLILVWGRHFLVTYFGDLEVGSFSTLAQDL